MRRGGLQVAQFRLALVTGRDKSVRAAAAPSPPIWFTRRREGAKGPGRRWSSALSSRLRVRRKRARQQGPPFSPPLRTRRPNGPSSDQSFRDSNQGSIRPFPAGKEEGGCRIKSGMTGNGSVILETATGCTSGLWEVGPKRKSGPDPPRPSRLRLNRKKPRRIRQGLFVPSQPARLRAWRPRPPADLLSRFFSPPVFTCTVGTWLVLFSVPTFEAWEARRLNLSFRLRAFE
jgi:hypothetical protein